MQKRNITLLIIIGLIILAVFILPKLGLFSITIPSGYTLYKQNNIFFGGGQTEDITPSDSGIVSSDKYQYWYYAFSKCIVILQNYDNSKCLSGQYSGMDSSSISQEGSFWDGHKLFGPESSNKCCKITLRTYKKQAVQSCSDLGYTSCSNEWDTKCAGTKRLRCSEINNLLCWIESYDCADDLQFCSNGECVYGGGGGGETCTEYSKCIGNKLYMCVDSSWVESADCSSFEGYICSDGACIYSGNGNGGGGGSGYGYNSTARQKGLTKSEIKTYTIQTILSSACTLSDQCESGSQCTSLQSLKDEGTISDIKATELVNGISDKISNFASIGGGLTAGIICAASILTGPISIPVCGAVGIVSGLGLDSLFSTLKESKLEKTGLCIKGGEGICSFVESLKLNFVKITGDACTDGMIIGGIIILLAIILMTRI